LKAQLVAHARLTSCLTLSFSLVLLFACPTAPIEAATPITPSGLNTQVTLSATPPAGKTQYDITGGTRPGGGANLFHSFGDFNVPNNNIANFLNNSGLPTTNILGRVTGGNISNIFGTIQTTGFGNANLFLMNPAGFLFGPNATVNVGGMVTFTSADYLRLTDNARFNAIPGPADALLSASPVAAFGFLGSNPGAITVQGSQLTVTDGTGISLVGGNITIQSGTADNGQVQSAKLLAPGGEVNLASVASPGEILSGTIAQAPNINSQSFGNLGSVQISQQSIIDVSGQTGGKIMIRSGQLAMDNGALQSNTVLGDSGGISIVSSEMNMKGGSIQTSTTGPGIAGDIAVDTRTLAMSGGAFMGSFSLGGDPLLSGAGHGGNIRINATESVSISGFLPGVTTLGSVPFMNLASGLYTTTFSDGRGGNIDATTPQLQLQGGFLQTQTFGAGRAGNIATTVGRLDVTEGGRLASTTLSTGDAGNITVMATDSIHVLGQFPGSFGTVGGAISTNVPSTISTNTRADGNGGQISISTPVLEMQTGLIIANATGTGQSGVVTVDVGELSLTKGASISSTAFGDGPGGSVSIHATGTVSISGLSGVTYSVGPLIFDNVPSGISTGTFGAQPSGNITLSAHNLVISDHGSIEASTGGDGAAGNISISAENATLATGANITSSTGFIFGLGGTKSFFGNGQGGAINLKADTLTVSGQGTAILSSTSAFGNGGKITLDVSRLDLRDGATLSGSAQGPGNAGTVTVQGAGGPAQSILIDGSGSGIFSTTEDTGAGGHISVAANSVTLQNGASISTSSTGPGTAGNININAGNQFTMNNASVTTEALHSSGGSIKITTNPNGTVQLTDSTISASVLDGTGGGGSVNIDPQFVILQNSQITANAVSGPGGNIFITTNVLLPDGNSHITATSQFGEQGNVTIQSPISPAGGKIVPLGQKPLIGTTLVGQRCAALAGGNISSFTVAGRDALPVEPGNWLSSPLATVSESENGQIKEVERMTSDEAPLLSVRKIAPPGFLTQAFAVESSGCQS
jgi:filamentous hemagglutinin family protein